MSFKKVFICNECKTEEISDTLDIPENWVCSNDIDTRVGPEPGSQCTVLIMQTSHFCSGQCFVKYIENKMRERCGDNYGKMITPP